MKKPEKELGELAFICPSCGKVAWVEDMKCPTCRHDVVIRRDSGQKKLRDRYRYKPLWKPGRKR